MAAQDLGSRVQGIIRCGKGLGFRDKVCGLAITQDLEFCDQVIRSSDKEDVRFSE